MCNLGGRLELAQCLNLPTSLNGYDEAFLRLPPSVCLSVCVCSKYKKTGRTGAGGREAREEEGAAAPWGVLHFRGGPARFYSSFFVFRLSSFVMSCINI